MFSLYCQILYTIGGVDNLEKSRSNFAQALRLDNNNMRALYGFFMVGNASRLVENMYVFDDP